MDTLRFTSKPKRWQAICSNFSVLSGIKKSKPLQSGSENMYKVYSDIFIDTSGDGVIAAESGAEFRMGREGKEEFNESIAADKPDKHTLGTSGALCLGRSRGC